MRQFLFATVALLSAPGAFAQTVTATAARAYDFSQSIGVNAHLNSEWDTSYSDTANGGTASFGSDPSKGAVIVNGRTYTNVSKIIAALRWIHVNHMRVTLPADYVADRLKAVTQAIPNLRIDLQTSYSDTIANQLEIGRAHV